MFMRSEKVIVALMLTVLLALTGYWLKNQFKIDSCFDLGGKWDYEEKRCLK
ncbi:hypothetical protein GCM10011613_29570 [Cellvibrio zantedeschiae]|uniref:TMhelix containing protein n=1 Tax=Cellvibrio zantedeschiae TaxID=1237077 RepID=A0ABQ3BBS5_9GAMM|nr:hypothetical protein GCM10011613_29570 [Cellvibrio zantedeschiae]